MCRTGLGPGTCATLGVKLAELEAEEETPNEVVEVSDAERSKVGDQRSEPRDGAEAGHAHSA